MDLSVNLLPAGWPRERAHALFLDRRERWTLPAREYFEGLERGLGLGTPRPPDDSSGSPRARAAGKKRLSRGV